jgi:hypothetical protein
MKTIIKTGSGLSKYLINDDVPVVFFSDRIEVGDIKESQEPESRGFVIADLNESNASLVEGVVELKTEWSIDKFIYDGGWKENPSWVDIESIRNEGEE